LKNYSTPERRSYNGYYDVVEGNPKHYFVKKETGSSWVQPTRWDEGCMKTTFMQIEPGRWNKVEDRQPVNSWRDFGDKVNLIVVVHGEALKMPIGSTRPNNPSVRAESRRTMTAAQKRSQTENVAMICVQDDTFHALIASIDEIEVTKVSQKASGCKSLGLLVGICFGLLLSLMTTLGFMASMHTPESQDERSAAETKLQEETP